MIVCINSEYYQLHYRDPGILRPEDKGLWRAYKVKQNICRLPGYTYADDDDYLITDDWHIVAKETGWDLRRESLE